MIYLIITIKAHYSAFLEVIYICGCHITAIILAFQAEDVGSTPISRCIPYYRYFLGSNVLIHFYYCWTRNGALLKKCEGVSLDKRIRRMDAPRSAKAAWKEQTGRLRLEGDSDQPLVAKDIKANLTVK